MMNFNFRMANKGDAIIRCQIQEWYPIFKPHTIQTLILPLPVPFLTYLTSTTSPFLLPSDDPTSASFSSFTSAVTSSIASLGGAAFPKLNWSSPKDASFMGVAGTLRCSSLDDVAVLLKSSDSISHDLSNPAGNPNSFVLALRKWYDGLRPEMEFRCFVRRNRVIAISQRDPTAFYPSLVEERSGIGGKVVTFFEEVVKGRFRLEDYVMDVYVRTDGKVKIVDFNPWVEYTLPLLFEWEELEREGFGFEFRVVESRIGVRPGLKTGVPFDYLDVSEGSGWDQFFKRAEEEMRRQQKPASEAQAGA